MFLEVSKKFRNFPVRYRKFLEGSGMFQSGAHLTCGVHLDQEGGAAANTRLAALALEAHVANKERGPNP